MYYFTTPILNYQRCSVWKQEDSTSRAIAIPLEITQNHSTKGFVAFLQNLVGLLLVRIVLACICFVESSQRFIILSLPLSP